MTSYATSSNTVAWVSGQTSVTARIPFPSWASFSAATAPIASSLTGVGGVVTINGAGAVSLNGVNGIVGSRFDDRLIGPANSAVFFEPGAGNDYVDGGTAPTQGQDRSAYQTVSYASSPAAVRVDLENHTADDGWGTVDTLYNISYIWGSMHNDWLRGDSEKNWISGLAGNDYIDGGPDADFGYVVSYEDDPSGVSVNLSLGRGVDGWGGVDTIVHMRSVHGSSFADRIVGSDGLNEFSGNAGADTIDGGLGLDFVRYWNSGRLLAANQPAGYSGRTGVLVDLSQNYAIDEWGDRDTLLNIEGVDVGQGDDVIIGNDLDNVFFVRGGNDRISGGAGLDIVNYARHIGGSLRSAHAVTRNNDVILVTSAQGTEELTGVERIVFSDGTLVVASTDPAFSVYRLYEAALNRAPDGPGLTAWTYANSTGMSMTTMAQQFMTAPEFVQRFGTPDNRGFVDLLYRNVLDRPADSAGASGWLGALNSEQMSREAVLLQFADSAENIVNVNAAVGDGVWLS